MTHRNDDWFWSLVLKAVSKSGQRIDESKLPEVVEKAVSEIIPRSARILCEELESKCPEILEERRRYEEGFRCRLLQRWKKPIDLLELFFTVVLEAGAEFNKKHRDEASRKNDYLFDVLTRMHARACQIGFEILVLLKNGFADGAYARWRTLHEIACVSYFIMEHGQDVAKRYLHYEVVESDRQAKAYQKYCRQLNNEPLTENEVKKLKDELNYVCKIYGSDFKRNYGWVPKGMLKTREFTEIEKSVKLDHLRPYYNMACYNIHSGPKGIRFRLGLMEGSLKQEALLAGPSNYGLAEPGQSTAISLLQTTTWLLTTKPTLERLILLKALQQLVDEICSAFCEVQFQIEEEELTN